MRLLVLTYRLPWHTFTADRYTMRHFLQYFSKRHAITLLAFAESQAEACQAATLSPFCERVLPVVLPRWYQCGQAIRGLASAEPLSVWFYRSPAMARAVRKVVTGGTVDLAYVYHLRMAQYLADLRIIPRCIALQPVQILNLQRFKENTKHPLWRALYLLEYRRMRRYEPMIARSFDRCLLISEKDRESLDENGELTNIFFNPHGLDPEFFKPNPQVPKEPCLIVFHGSMRYRANADAITYFCREIFPIIKNEKPQAKLAVVGYEPPAVVRALARDDSVVVTGSVDDVRPYLWRAEVAIDPLRIGAGLQNKVLESMATALPVVATSLANEGIGAKAGAEILLANDPREFAAKVCLLFRDRALARRLSAAGRRFVERHWSWETHYRPLEDLFEELVSTAGDRGWGTGRAELA